MRSLSYSRVASGQSDSFSTISFFSRFTALALFIAAYNLAGSIFLFNKGLLLFAVFPEAQICEFYSNP